jgi:hypothetical protein
MGFTDPAPRLGHAAAAPALVAALLLLAATFPQHSNRGARIYANFALHQPAFSFNDENIPLFPIQWMWQAPAADAWAFVFPYADVHPPRARDGALPLRPALSRVRNAAIFYSVSQLDRHARSVHPHQKPDSHARGLFDIGIAGPIAGFIPSCVAVLVGLSLSHPLMFAGPLDNEPGFPAGLLSGRRACCTLTCQSHRYPCIRSPSLAGWECSRRR